MKHLKPKTPASCSAGRSAALAGTAPPQKPTSTAHWPAAACRFASSAAKSVVGGIEFSGMSMIVVTPPAAAALVAVAKPSQSVRPGSLTCTWVSTRPGSRTSSSRRVIVGTSRPADGELPGAFSVLTERIWPSRMLICAGPMPAGVTTRLARMMRSAGWSG